MEETAVALELGPDTREREHRPIIIQSKPNDVFLFRLGVRFRRIFREAVAGTRQRVSGFSQPRQ
jgi:hypothetical protein